MSIPGFAWARERGRALGLPALDRLLLMVLSDMANGARVCWPLLQTLMLESGIRKRALINTLQRLEAAGLIRIEKWGRSQRYHILRPVDDGEQVHQTHRSNGGKVHGAHPSPTNGAGRAPVNGAPNAPISHERCTSGLGKVHQTTRKGAPDAPRTLLNQEREPSGARIRTREAAEVLSFPGNGTPQPEPSSPPAPAEPPTVEFGSYLEQLRARRAAPLAMGQEVVRGEPVADDDNPPVDPGVVLAELESLRRSMRMKAYPPRAAAMSPDEQAEALCPRRPQAHHLPDAQLRAARVELAARAAARGVVP